MIKFEGMAGLKIDWVLTELQNDLEVEEKKTVKKVFVQALMDLLNYDELLDKCADILTEDYTLAVDDENDN